MHASPRPFPLRAGLPVLVLVALLSGCAASEMSNMWRDVTFQSTPLKNVLVVALRSDMVRRRLWEDSFAGGLAAHGTTATPSYRIWPAAPPDTQQVVAELGRDGYDGIVVAMRLPDGVEKKFVPGYTHVVGVVQQSPFTGAYFTVWRDVPVPARAESVTVANFQFDAWVTGPHGRLVWSGSHRTTDGEDATFIQDKVERMILPEMSKAGIISRKSR